MRVLFGLIALFLSQSLFGQFFNIQQSHKEIWATEQKAHENKIFKTSGVQALNNFDIVYHHCDWFINPAVDSIRGSIQTLFRPQVGSFNTLQFDLSNGLMVDSVMYHGNSIAFAQKSGDILEITFPQIIATNALDSVTVIYQGTPGTSGFGSWEQTTHNGVPVIWTLSEPYGAKDWWPCKQNLLDKIDSIDIVVTTPIGNRAAANGLLHAETVVGQNKRYEWRHRHPIVTYLVAIAVTNYIEYYDYAYPGNDTVDILNYIFPEDSTSAAQGTANTGIMIELFDSLTIPYPFADEKYGHAQFGWGGGMEHQTMSFMGGFNWSLVAHELAHQWFGDHVTCGSWEDIWLNEGFATYFEGLTIENYIPQYWLQWKNNLRNYITSQPGGSVLCDDTTSTGRIFDGRLSYYKGAYVINMLRWQVGDSAFFSALRNYLNDPILKAGFARTPDLQRHMEQASGQNLTTFFDQWYYKEGHPSYNISWSQDTSFVWMMVNQSQSHNSVQFFEMPIPIKLYGGGKDTTLVFNHTSSGQHFSAKIDFQIDSLVFDPEAWILSRNNNASIGFAEYVANNLVIYPNPASASLTVEGMSKAQEWQIFDMTGRLLLRETNSNRMDKVDINTSSLKAGTYILTIKSGNGTTKSVRFLIQ